MENKLFLKIVKIINSCKTVRQCSNCFVLVKRFEKFYTTGKTIIFCRELNELFNNKFNMLLKENKKIESL